MTNNKKYEQKKSETCSKHFKFSCHIGRRFFFHTCPLTVRDHQFMFFIGKNLLRKFDTLSKKEIKTIKT